MRSRPALSLSAPDQQPQKRKFPNSENLRELANALRGPGQKKKDRGGDHVTEARNHNRDADRTGDKAGSDHRDATRKEPQSTEYMSESKSQDVTARSHRDEGV